MSQTPCLDALECDEQARPRRRSQATEIVDLAAALDLYRSPDGEAYVDVRVAAHRETHALRSQSMRDWLARAYHTTHGRVPSTDAVREALGVLAGRALWDGPVQPVAVRVGEHDGAIYLDLGDLEWRAVEVTPQGWGIVGEPPVRFRRGRGMLPLPEPARGGTLDALRALLRVEDGDWPLLVGWLLGALRPRGPYPVLALHGEPGAAKSTTARMLRALVDPHAAPLRAEPREHRDLIAAARAGWVLALDNVSRIPPWLSDALCCLATGGGYAARQLYTDLDELVVDVQRPVILTSIEAVCTRGDLADRAIGVTLPVMLEAACRPERELWPRLAAVLPGVLGALLDAAACGLRELPSVRLPTLPRMADYAEWLAACEPGRAVARGTLFAAYVGSRVVAAETALEASAVATALRDHLAAAGEYQGTLTALLDTLAERVPDTVRRDRRRWPQSARGLRAALDGLGPALRAARVEVTHSREPGGSRRRTVRVATVPTVPTVPIVPDPHADGGRSPGRSGDDPGATVPPGSPVSAGLRNDRDGRDGLAR